MLLRIPGVRPIGCSEGQCNALAARFNVLEFLLCREDRHGPERKTVRHSFLGEWYCDTNDPARTIVERDSMDRGKDSPLRPAQSAQSLIPRKELSHSSPLKERKPP